MNERIIFDCLIEMCKSAGGDGDSMLTSPRYKYWAELFSQRHSDWERSNSEFLIVFYDDQETVWFTSEEHLKNI